MPFGPTHPRGNLLAYVILMTGVIISSAIGYHELRQESKDRTKTIAQIALVNCREIESLKSQVRRDAIKNFAELDETLRLLNIRKSEEIVNRARSERDETLENFKPEPCPRRIIQ